MFFVPTWFRVSRIKKLFQQEFNYLGVIYHPINNYFPRTRPHLYCRDGYLENPEMKPVVQSQVLHPS
ncbi:hypothetical protein AMECASPLE_028546 [Ameca splendens]|uniref:Uncharacterized protein n=1 Tax=Ameca splendens TaxID=208324 RepID=A0ABV0XUD1_9TELE